MRPSCAAASVVPAGGDRTHHNAIGGGRNCDCDMKLSGKAECCWMVTAPRTSYRGLVRNGEADVAVIGAGIVGLTTACLLAQAGLSVSLLEARRIGRQVTGRSTAKITCQHGLIYRHLIETFDFDLAKRYAEANRTGVEQIRNWIDELDIACDFEQKDAYTYTVDSTRHDEIEAEAEAARRVGFKAEVLGQAPLPFETAAALRFPDQAQFNPAQYLIGLARAFKAAGGRIFENTRVTKVDPGKRWRVTASRGALAVRHVVVATNLPIAGPVAYDGRTQPRCHTAMAFRMAPRMAIDGMFIGIDEPTHSLRTGRDRDGPLLVALGPKFNTGQDGDVAARFRALEQWVRQNLEAGDAVWRWTNEDYDTADRVPFVGQPSKQAAGLYVATGFNGWGISNGTAAGISIADRIVGKPNSWASIYDPTRRSPKGFNQGGDTQSGVADIEAIPNGQGGVIRRGKEKLAVWKDTSGKPHVLSAACTHLGCTVTWNNADRTWDCPCHGSMFSADGDVIHGPAVRSLAARRLPSMRRRRARERQKSVF
jgi:glycine/D-amino acid oxidase-like deaminating enzyme/nitrite reductase/ring-hydroxylating ferredoxin subunit